jgi:hypothetical protein
LKKEPAPLSRPIWKKLRSYDLVKTPQERREELLCNTATSVKEETAYSNDVKRALMGVLALDERTRNLEVVFKSGAEAELDLLLHGWRVLINDKWLDFHSSHDSGGCDLSVEASRQHVNIDTFDCGHIITELYDSLVAELSRYQRDHKLSAEGSSALRRRAAEKIRQTPSRVSVAQGESLAKLSSPGQSLGVIVFGKTMACFEKVESRCIAKVHAQTRRMRYSHQVSLRSSSQRQY